MSIKNQNDLLCFILLYLIIYLLMIIFFFMCGFDGLTIGFGALILLFLIMLAWLIITIISVAVIILVAKKNIISCEILVLLGIFLFPFLCAYSADFGKYCCNYKYNKKNKKIAIEASLIRPTAKEAYILDNYIEQNIKIINRFWPIDYTAYPKTSTTLEIKLSNNTKIVSVKILKSSGNTEYDQLAIRAVKDSEPFWIPFPEELKYRKTLVFKLYFNRYIGTDSARFYKFENSPKSSLKQIQQNNFESKKRPVREQKVLYSEQRVTSEGIEKSYIIRPTQYYNY